MKWGVIYKLTNPVGAIYIGQSISLKERIRSYKNLNCKSQGKLYNSLVKYGFNTHRVEILKICPDFLLNSIEADFIITYDSIKNGLNISSLPAGRLTQEAKDKISLKLTGKKHSEETKLKMSLSHIGLLKGIKKTSGDFKRYNQMIPVVRVSIMGEEKVYESLLAVERDGFDSVNVGRICKGDKYRHTHKGFNWKYLKTIQNV